MTDDFSDLVTGANCYAISSATVIYAYKNSTRTTYNQIGGKWFKTAENAYSGVPNNTICYAYGDITKINSKAEYFPIFEFMALIMAIFVWYFVFRLLSRLIRWRI